MYHHFGVFTAGNIVIAGLDDPIAAFSGRSRRKSSETLAARAHERHVGELVTISAVNERFDGRVRV